MDDTPSAKGGHGSRCWLLPLVLMGLAFGLAGCGGTSGGTSTGSSTGTSTSTATERLRAAAELPELWSLAVYDQPLAAAKPEVRRAWEIMAAIRSERLPPGQPSSVSETTAWISGTFAPWLAECARALGVLDEVLRPLRVGGEPRDALFSAIAFAAAAEHFYDEVQRLPVSEAIPRDAELRQFIADEFTTRLRPLAERALAAYDECVARAGAAPPTLAGWSTRCEERAASMRARLAESEGASSEE